MLRSGTWIFSCVREKRIAETESSKKHIILSEALIYSNILPKTNEKTSVQKTGQSLCQIPKYDRSVQKNQHHAGSVPESQKKAADRRHLHNETEEKAKIENLAKNQSERTGCQEGTFEKQKKISDPKTMQEYRKIKGSSQLQRIWRFYYNCLTLYFRKDRIYVCTTYKKGR